MKEIKILSKEDKRIGRKNYLAFCAMNGLSIAFLAETTLMLYALKIGVPDYIVAVISSCMFLGTFFVIAGRRLVILYGTSKAAAMAWYLRNIFGGFTALAPLVMVYFSPFLGVVVILVGAIGFYVFRGVGIAALMPMLGEITEQEEKGTFNAKTAFLFNIGYFAAMTILIILFKLTDTVSMFQFIIIFGFLVGCYSSYKVSKVPESGHARESADFSFWASLKYTLEQKEIRNLLAANIMGYSSMALVLPFSVLAAKEVYEIRDFSALFLVLIQGGGGAVFAFIASKFVKKDSFRKNFLFSYFALMMVALLWTVMPMRFNIIYTIFVFFAAGVGQVGIYMFLAHYYLAVVPEKRLVGTNMALLVVSSLIAGLVGIFFGAVVLESLEFLNIEEVNLYRIFFAILFCVITFGFIIMLRLERPFLTKEKPVPLDNIKAEVLSE